MFLFKRALFYGFMSIVCGNNFNELIRLFCLIYHSQPNISKEIQHVKNLLNLEFEAVILATGT